MSDKTYLPDIHRMLPQSEEAEKGVLSCLVLSPNEVGAICSKMGIDHKHFHTPAHSLLFRAATALWKAGKPLDFITLTQFLRDKGKLDQAGGAAAVSSLFTFLPTAANAEYYLGLLTEKAIARALIHLGTKYASKAYDEQGGVNALAAELHREVCELLGQGRIKDQPIKEVLKEILQEIASGKEDESNLPTYIPALDQNLKLYRSDFVAIKGGTGSGKSSLGSQIIVETAIRGSNNLFFPLEMSAKQCLKRAIAGISGHNMEAARFQMKVALRTGDMSGTQEMQRDVANAVQQLISSNLRMPKSCRTLNSIIGECRSANAEKQLDFVLIDYIQLLHIEGTFSSRQLSIGHATQTLKRLADELKCIIITPSQVNKEGVSREAADIENDANSVIAIDYNKDDGERKIRIDKQREGASGIEIPLEWNGPLTKFSPIK